MTETTTEQTIGQRLKGCLPRALGDKIVVQPFDADEKTDGGIVLPDQAKEKPRCGEVYAVGPGKFYGYDDDGEPMFEPLAVKKGAFVVFSQYSGVEVKIGRDTFLVMAENEIACVLERPVEDTGETR